MSPVDSLKEFLTANKVIVFESASDQEANERLKVIFEQLSVTHARVNLSERIDFGQTLVLNADTFNYRGPEHTQVYLNSANAGSAAELASLEVADLAAKIPDGCIQESLEQRLGKLVKQHDIMLFMKGNPEDP